MAVLSFEDSWGITSPQEVLEHHKTAKSAAPIPGQKEGQFTVLASNTHPRPARGKSIQKL